MIIRINGIDTEINESLFSYSELIEKRDQIKYPQFDFSSINYMKGEKNILETCFQETKKEFLSNGY